MQPLFSPPCHSQCNGAKDVNQLHKCKIQLESAVENTHAAVAIFRKKLTPIPEFNEAVMESTE